MNGKGGEFVIGQGVITQVRENYSRLQGKQRSYIEIQRNKSAGKY